MDNDLCKVANLISWAPQKCSTHFDSNGKSAAPTSAAPPTPLTVPVLPLQANIQMMALKTYVHARNLLTKKIAH